jgi:hypothetical protein
MKDFYLEMGHGYISVLAYGIYIDVWKLAERLHVDVPLLPCELFSFRLKRIPHTSQHLYTQIFLYDSRV